MKNWLDSFSAFEKVILGVIATALLAGGIFLIRSILSSILLAMIVSLILAPLVQLLQKLKVPRTAAVAGVLVGLMVGVATGVYLLIPLLYGQIVSFETDLPRYLDTVRSLAQAQQSNLFIQFPFLSNLDLVGEVTSGVQSLMSSVFLNIPGLLSNVFGLVQLFVIVPFTSFFLLKDGPEFKAHIKRWIPNRYADFTNRLSGRVQKQISSYMLGVLIESLAVGGLSSIGLLFLHVKYAVIIGMFAGFANIIPYLGPTCGAIPALVVMFIDPVSSFPWWSVIVLFAIVQFLDNHLLQPMIYSRTVNLHPVFILFGIIIGSEWAGFLGMLVAVPTLGILNVIIEELNRELT